VLVFENNTFIIFLKMYNCKRSVHCEP